ncbi:lipoyl(octanoyl) transferase LipB [Agarivorans aestuarii]|uniref:Octanoyltransferase n=1 Tax=Agarivorans aestuarii TaxID=1563703 RepID=A0ABU7FZP2_9ALTE|nr:lipoyl(octanoyl) transferase LipB [Agarivorans aestuarii]MEE1672627.1 lipoyl(octanoyl) transferase LipB [Agarivorans aestuarii]
MPEKNRLIIRQLGLQDYSSILQAMRDFTDQRSAEQDDELWLVEHQPVFTQGQAGKAEHLLASSDIPVVQADRGGQVTYHGPGQLVAYPLVNLRRRKLGVRDLVTIIEQSIIDTLGLHEIEAFAKKDAPGVYVEQKKIASLGLRIRKGCSFHGLALNVDMDLSPFLQINPCGYAGLEMAQISDYVATPNISQIAEQLSQVLVKQLAYSSTEHQQGLPTL